MRWILGLSIALNLFLLTTMVAARVDTTRDSYRLPHQIGPAIESEYAQTRFPEFEQIVELLDVLQQAGIGERDTRRLALGWLVSKIGHSQELPRPEYWQNDYNPALNDLQSRVQIESRVRQALIETFGPESKSDPLFDAVFRPLGAEYSFLDSDGQLKLQDRQLELMKRTGALGTMPVASTALCDSARSTANNDRSTNPGGAGIVANREYRLRFSILAQQLRESAASKSEQEFRSLFDRIEALERNSDAGVQARLRRELRALMGSDRFDRFWSIRDPLFQEIAGFLQGEGLTEREIMNAYSITNRYQEALLSAIARDPGRASLLTSAMELRQDRENELNGLLGERVASGLSGAMNRAAVRLGNSMISRCPR